MKKITITTLLLTAVILTGCLNKPQAPVNENQNINVNSEEIDTSDWETYRNEEYGFEFKYPGEWDLLVDNDKGWFRSYYLESDDILKLIDIKNSGLDKNPSCSGGGPGTPVQGASFKFFVRNNRTKESFDSLINNCISSSETGSCGYEERVVNDNRFLLVKDWNSPCNFPVAYIIRGNLIFVVDTVWWTQDKSQQSYYRNLFYTLLDTFKID